MVYPSTFRTPCICYTFEWITQTISPAPFAKRLCNRLRRPAHQPPPLSLHISLPGTWVACQEWLIPNRNRATMYGARISTKWRWMARWKWCTLLSERSYMRRLSYYVDVKYYSLQHRWGIGKMRPRLHLRFALNRQRLRMRYRSIKGLISVHC